MRHRKWRTKGQTNSVNDKQISPRISVIAAVSTEGEVYMSLSTVNTDEDSFRLFVSKLAAKLNVERPGWKKDTVWLIDNASYHSGQQTRAYFAA